MPDKQTAKKFIDWMHGPAASRGHRILTWYAPSKASSFHETPKAAAAHAVKTNANKENAYVGMGQFSDPPSSGRGTAARVTAVGGFWADVDFGPPDDVHKRRNLPPDEVSAMNLLKAVGAEPSVVTHSGHGIQAFWLFDAPWIIESREDRTEAAKAMRLWSDTLKLVASKFGWSLDSVHDLARVMRVPGTVNWKRPDEPVEARIVSPPSGQPKRWRRDELAGLMLPEELSSGNRGGRAPVAKVEPVAPREDGAAPAAVTALCQNDPTFKRTWERKRTDHPEWTASEYDLSIASQLAHAGCTDQIIADAILARRTLHSENPDKARRRDYLMRTISRARTVQESDGAMNDVAVMVDSPKPESTEDADTERRQAARKIGQALRVDLLRVIKHGREDSVYSLELGNGSSDPQDVLIGGVRSLLNQREFTARLADASGVVIRQVKRDRWDKAVQLMLRTAILVENEDASRMNRITSWLRTYVVEGHQTLFSGEDWPRALVNNDPFVGEDGRLHVHVDAFRRFLRFTEPERVERSYLFHLLRLAGFGRVSVNGRIEGRKLCRSYWAGPAQVLGDDVLSSKRKMLGAKNGSAQEPSEEGS